MEFCRLVLRVWLVGGHTVQSLLAPLILGPGYSRLQGVPVQRRYPTAIPDCHSKAAAPVGTGLTSYEFYCGLLLVFYGTGFIPHGRDV